MNEISLHVYFNHTNAYRFCFNCCIAFDSMFLQVLLPSLKTAEVAVFSFGTQVTSMIPAQIVLVKVIQPSFIFISFTMKCMWRYLVYIICLNYCVETRVEVIQEIYYLQKDKKEEIWPSPMTKAPTPTEMSKRPRKQHKQRYKKVRLHSNRGPKNNAN